MKSKIILLLIGVLCWSCRSADNSLHHVQVVGAMRQVMWNGELEGKIKLDSLSKKNYYGLGPLSYLKGELLLLDGKTYVGKVESDTTMLVLQDSNASAPFFVYTEVNQWKSQKLAKNISNQAELEIYLNEQKGHPFAFKLKGKIQSAVIHLQNLPEGTKVSSPQEAHQGQVNYELMNKEVEILGFFSTEHKGIFTHHDSFIHLHLITADQKMMGHVDEIVFEEMELLLPVE